jgi:WD40 repeat protein
MISNITLKRLRSLFPQKYLALAHVLGSHDLKTQGPTKEVQISPDNKSFWTRAEALYQWDATTGHQIKYSQREARSFMIDGASLLAMTPKGLYRFGKQSTLLQSLPLQSKLNAASFSRGGTHALVFGSNSCQVFELTSEKPKSIAAFQWAHTYAWLFPEADGILLYSLQTLTVVSLKREMRWVKRLEDTFGGAAFLSATQIVCSLGGKLSCLSLVDGKELWCITLSESLLNGPAVSQNQQIIVSNAEKIFLLSSDGSLLRSFDGFSGLSQLAISPDASWMVACEHSSKLSIIDLPSGKERFLGAGHPSKINSISWLNATQFISNASYDKQARVWDAGSGETKHTLEVPSTHQGVLVAAPDGKSFFVNLLQEIYHYDTESGELLGLYQAYKTLGNIYVSADGEQIYGLSYGSGIFAWKLGQAKPSWSIERPPASAGWENIFQLSMSQQTQSIWAFTSSYVYQYKASTGEELQRYSIKYQRSLLRVALSFDESFLVGHISELDRGDYEEKLICWKLDDPKERWSQRSDKVKEIYLSKTDRWFLYLSVEGNLHVCSINDGEVFESIGLHSIRDGISCFAVSPDDKRVAVGTERGLILVFEINFLENTDEDI